MCALQLLRSRACTQGTLLDAIAEYASRGAAAFPFNVAWARWS